MGESRVSVPLPVRLQFGHAAVQYVADEIGADILHIKGAAVDPTLRPSSPAGSDVDVLVRPAHVARLNVSLQAYGWRIYSTFEYGSPFGHAQTYLHDDWGFLDIHRFFPGIRLEPDAAFELLWDDRTTVQIAGSGCAVPNLPAQATLLVLNAARASKHHRDDVVAGWTNVDAGRRVEVSALVGRLHAEVAFAAAIGDLERHRDAREYRLWKVVSEGGSRSEEWWARIRAAPTVSAALRVAAKAPRVNIDHLAHRLGRAPTRKDVFVEFLRRPLVAAREAIRGASRRQVRR